MTINFVITRATFDVVTKSTAFNIVVTCIGIDLVAAIAGTTDVDAITLSMAQYAQQAGREQLAATALVIAVLSNTLVKTVLVCTLGSAGLRQRLLSACGLVVLTAILLLAAL